MSGLGGTSIPVTNLYIPTITSGNTTYAAQRFRQINLVGRVPADEKTLPSGSRLVRLRVNGQLVTMRIEDETMSPDLTFDTNSPYSKDLYRAILTKRVEVVGDAAMRTRILDAVTQKQAIQIDGYAFDRLSPYLVLRSVSSAQ